MEPVFVQIFSELFGIPRGYFVYPTVIFYFILPFLAATYFWYVLLSKKLKIFKRAKSANVLLSFLLSFFNVTIILGFAPPWVSVPIFISMSLLLPHRWTWKKILLVLVVFILLARSYPWLMSLI